MFLYCLIQVICTNHCVALFLLSSLYFFFIAFEFTCCIHLWCGILSSQRFLPFFISFLCLFIFVLFKWSWYICFEMIGNSFSISGFLCVIVSICFCSFFFSFAIISICIFNSVNYSFLPQSSRAFPFLNSQLVATFLTLFCG